jgi:hypothetical protein
MNAEHEHLTCQMAGIPREQWCGNCEEAEGLRKLRPGIRAVTTTVYMKEDGSMATKEEAFES